MSKSRLFSGKIKKLSGGQLSVDRYEYLDVSQAEPDLGLPETDSSVLLGGTDGSRYWSQTLTNVTLDLVTITTGTVNGVLSIVNDTQSTSTTTGALVISGGLAVGGNIHFGGDLYQNGTLFASGITSDSTITAVSLVLTTSTQATSTETGALVVAGGVGIGGDLYANALYATTSSYVAGSEVLTTATIGLYAAAASSTTGTTSTFVIANSTPSTSTATGALTVEGGVGISGNLYVGGEIVAEKLTIQLTTITTTSIVTDDVFTVGNDTNSVSTETGALTVAGGVGIGKDLQIAGEIFRNGISVGYGYTGSRGYDGSVGYTGSQGETGFVGSQGDLGYTGSQGDIGYTGSAGLDGTSGTSGTDGYTGSQGDIGYTGSQGEPGSGGITVGDTPPESPSIGDLWYRTTNDVLYRYLSSFWIDVTGPVYTFGLSNAAIEEISTSGVPPIGQEAFTTPGTYSWTAPADVFSVCVVCIGAGGGVANALQGIGGGSGGGLGWKNNIAVTPGQSYTVVVGAGSTTAAGGDSYFIQNDSNSYCAGKGGRVGYLRYGAGGGFFGDGGGAGGGGGGEYGWSSDFPYKGVWGGGGAGGYAASSTNHAGSAESGRSEDGSGSGAGGNSNRNPGGGVGIYGKGATGLYGGNPGSGGSGTSYGGGAGGSSAGQVSGGGAVRIIWGRDRAFPDTLTTDQ